MKKFFTTILVISGLSVIAQNKVNIHLNTGSVTSYETEKVESVDFGDNNDFTVSFKDGSDTKSYDGNAAKITFTKRTVNQDAVVITEIGGWFETAYVDFEPYKGAKGYNVYFKKASNVKYTKIDDELIREYNGYVRADVVGLSAGDYILKVVPKDNSGEVESAATETDIINVKAYDRSGYAHFKYTEGVGAYKDDGTLKDNAIVIYVTDKNKNTVSVPGYENCGTGIGWILNNNQYSSSTSNTYTADYKKMGIYAITKDHPVAIRFIGKVTMPEGVTAYNSTNYGGSEGDNGGLARMKDARNITIEGIGFDAEIYGWGFHFIASDKSGEYGKNFEARNLRFRDYPEDAIGMEGQQTSSNTASDISAPVQHCWVHNCHFYQGYCANPAESDKAEGDGSCDFKRGRFFTLGYNIFEYGHKTNLIGSSDASLQYDITFHHNIWNNCQSRVPLLRNANMHFYNNYVYGDMTDSKASLSYIASCRANSYLFSENNYYDGCKNICQTTSGGVSKSFGNIYYACFGDNNAVMANSRTEKVTNNCQYQYGKIDYSSFDTNSDIFYYNSASKKTDGYITDAVTARQECILYSGTMREDGYISTAMNVNNVNGSIVMNNGTYTATIGKSETGILFTSSKEKFKGQGITFRISSPAKLSVTGGTDSYGGPYLVKSDGTLIGQIKGGTTTTFNLTSGLYFIGSGSKDKESSVSSMVFTGSVQTAEERISDAKKAIDNIPSSITYTQTTLEAIVNAEEACSALKDNEKSEVDYDKVVNAREAYNKAGGEYIDGLIASIGTVSATSGTAINAARSAYNNATDGVKQKVTKLSVLVAAEDAYKQFAPSGNNSATTLTFDNGATDPNGVFSVNGNLKSGVSPKTYNGVTYTTALKMESSTSITFTSSTQKSLTIITDTVDGAVVVDGTKMTTNSDGVLQTGISAGNHTILKGSSLNVYAVIIE